MMHRLSVSSISTLSDSRARLKAGVGESDRSADGDDTVRDLAKVLRAFKLKNVSTVKDVAAENLTKEPVDDRTYLMERIIDLAADLPVNSMASQSLTNSFLSQLWGDLSHPPKSYLGDEYIYRKADGSNNNFLWPHVGAAGQPYARSIKALDRRPIARPDPGVIFDSVLKRKTFKEHPNKISSVLFYIASIIIHDCFHTNHDDFNISDTSSYLDLSPLYGNNEETQRSVRTMKDGKLKPDCFADPRILGFPPGVGALLIFFNRFHNDVVERLAQIDENGRFSRILRPKKRENEPRDANGNIIQPPDPAVLYDEALFQTARLVTCGLYVNIILKDYVRTILNLNRVDTDWNLDPRSPEGRALFGEKIPEATGNQVSAEFNLVYRWHSCISEKDAAWTQRVYQQMFPSGKANHMPSTHDFLQALKELGKSLRQQSPEQRSFAGLQRTANGKYRDDDLAAIWTESVTDVAGAFGANNVPEIFKPVEILGIIQARSWNLASLNELRKYFKLKPWTSFKDMNPDPEVSHNLELLYEHPDNVELYPGIILEAAKKPLAPGSGLCTNFTTSRAILSDAVALVRGDRFYTVDYTTSNLTNYGFSMADSDLHINYGCVIYKLILTALPNNYAENSIYAHYPLTIPTENEKILTDLGRAHLYAFTVPARLATPIEIKSYTGCKAVFESAMNIRRLPRVQLSHGPNGLHDRIRSPPLVLTAMRDYLSTSPPPTYIRRFFERTTSKLISQHSHTLAGTHRVDIIRDVVNVSQVHFVACLFALPLRETDRAGEKSSAMELWEALTLIHSSIHARQDPVRSFQSQQSAGAAMLHVGSAVEDTIRSFGSGKQGIIASIIDRFYEQDTSDLTDQSAHFLQTILKSGIAPEQLVYQYLLPVAAHIAVVQARAFADCIDYYLSTEEMIFPEIRRLSLLDSDEADIQIEQYALQALQANSNLKTYTRSSNRLDVEEAQGLVEIPAGEVVLCDLFSAHRGRDVSAQPGNNRKNTAEQDFLPGLPGFPPEYPGLQLGRPAIVGMMKSLSRLNDLRRFPGAQGRMKKVKSIDGSELYLEADEEAAHIWPDSMKVNYD